VDGSRVRWWPGMIAPAIREALRQAQANTASSERVRRNVTDPDSRLMKGRQGFLQGYNGQAMATVDLVVIAAECR
jgi:hypothetical protein